MASALRLGLPRPAASLLRSQPMMMTTTTTATTHPCHSLLLPVAASIPNTASRHAFSTTAATSRRVGYPDQGVPRDDLGASVPLPLPHGRDKHIPAYPYGPRLLYKQSNSGLYGSARIRFGNNVSEKHGVKTRRIWRPNLHRRRLWSHALRCFVQTRVTVRVLRTIDKCGGLDEYLLGSKAQRIKDLGPWGWKLRWRIMQSRTVRERFAAERERLGLPPKSSELVEQELNEQIMIEMGAAGENAALPAGGETERQKMIAEMDRMISADEEFLLGDVEAGKDEGFMKEQRP